MGAELAAQEHDHGHSHDPSHGHTHNHNHTHHTARKTDSHLTGHVTDSSTGQHLPYITIVVEGTQLASLTDGTGHFSLYNVPIGRHTITASSVGYQSQSLEVEILKDKTGEIKFELAPSMLEIDEVVVSGSRNETSRKESSSIVNVVSTKLFEKVAATNTAEVLNYQPGLRVEYNCSNCGVPQLRINGLEGQYSQILLDSRPIFSSLAGVYGLEQLPAGMIERVEVIRGGGSALFGSSAIGGVVNIITKEPLRSSAMLSNQTSFNEEGGAEVNTTLNASVVSNDFRSGAYIYGTIKNRDEYDRNGDGFSEVPRLKGATLGMRAYHRFGKYSKITADYHYID
ncbi:MAG: carboxypeptidase-like regulatory domain-containing protein, partial [Rikenellaceae bacterium]|nr:carboxypeptidase-like regulatory domain-containing protein [Rikenellaceae bacterium]